MDVDYDKLLQSIELVAYNKLDECRDDTLIEKLVTVFDLSFNDLNCSNQQLNDIFNLCRELIEKWKSEKSKLFIGPIFSFIFKLISSFQVQEVIGNKIIILQLNQLLDLKKEVFKCDYSIQTYYIKGLNKLFSSRSGSKIVFSEILINDLFVQKLIDLGLASKSFFVKESIQQCLVDLLKRSCEFDNDEITKKYVQLIISSFEFKFDKFQIKIIGQLLKSEKKAIIFKLFPNFNQILINQINCQMDESVNLQLVELLANNLDDESQINFIFTKLIKNKLLKPLIIFSANLASRDSSYLNKWFTYVVLPLELEIDIESINSNDKNFEYSELDKHFVKLLTTEKSLIYCLHYLKINFPKNLTNRQSNQVFEIIEKFIQKLIKESRIKLLRESILMIGNLSRQIEHLEPKLFGILVDLLISLLWSDQFQCECLIWLRHLFENKFSNQLIENKEIKLKLTNLLNQIFNLELKDENLDVIDGGLELIEILIKNDLIQFNELDESILRSIFKIWNYAIDHSDNYSLKASCISILFNLQLKLDQSTIHRLIKDSGYKSNHLSIDKLTTDQANILEVIWKCLKDENSLVRKKVIESIKGAILKENQLKNDLMANELIVKSDGKLYLEICYHISESILFDIDADIQSAAINLLVNLIINILNMKSSDQLFKNHLSKIKFKGLINFIHCLHSTVINNLVCFTVKEECQNSLQRIKNFLDENSLSKNDLISILENNETKSESIFKYQVNGYHEMDNNLNETENNSNDESAKKRDKELNEMFKDNLFHTEEIIFQFTNERFNQLNNQSAKFKEHQTLVINKININDLVEFIYLFDPKNFLNNKIKVDLLDDILAAKSNDDVIIDCY